MQMRVGKDTYGLFLISDNCYGILRDPDHIEELKKKLKKEKMEYINSWTLFGVHDTAILIRSEKRLDPAVDAVGEWLAECTEQEIPIDIDSRLDMKPSIKCKCECISDLYEGARSKNFRIFEYRVDPLVPIYVDTAKMKDHSGVFLITYIKFDPRNVNRILNIEKSGNLRDLYRPFENEDTVAIFHGFGLFDVIVITNSDNYKGTRNMMVGIRKESDLSISNTYFLTSIPRSLDDLGFPSLNCSMMVKIKSGAEDSDIWNGMRELAKDVGLEGLCIRKVPDSNLIRCPPHTSFRPGFFDVAIDLRFKKITNLIEFVDILERMPFVEDTATVISYDTDMIG